MPLFPRLRRILVWLCICVLWASAPARAATAEPLGASPITNHDADAAELILRSIELLGLEYRYGGSTPAEGLDCSGFIRHVFREALGLAMPRRSEEMSQIGVAVSREDLKPGDLVFFNTLRRPFSHVGLYVGGDRFVHAPSTGNVIRIEPMNVRYWLQRFEGGRRVLNAKSMMAKDAGGLDRLIDTIARSGPERTAGAASDSQALAPTGSWTTPTLTPVSATPARMPMNH